jgi:hypothetical protein
MSLANEASLLLIPSGYKSGKVYSVFPTDGDGDFTFSRGSDGTRKGAGGLIETMSSNIPRLDYSNGDCPSLLLEPERTNEFFYSEEFNQNVWFKSNSTITTNQTIAPDGTLTADLLTSTASGGGVYKFAGWQTTQKTISIFVKKNSSNTAEIFNASSGTNRVVFDLNNGTIITQGGTMTGKIEDFENDWYRLSATHTASGSQTFGLKPSTNLSLFIWGAQSESAAFSTSYIKTTGSTVTRLIDFGSGSGSSNLFNDSEGTFFINAAALGYDGTYRVISICDGGTSNRVLIQLGNNNNQIRADIISNGSTQASISTYSYNFTNFNKIAVRYKQNDVALYVNGTQIGTDTNANNPVNLNTLNFTNGNLGSLFYFRAKLKQLMYFDRGLSNSELVTLTTL